MTIRLILIAAAVLSVTAFADTTADRAKLTGKWQMENNGKPAGEIWTIEDNTMRRECEIKDSGKNAKVSIWYSGPKLVQMETRGSDVVKRRFSVIADKGQMEMELIAIVPAGKPETIRFTRVLDAAAIR